MAKIGNFFILDVSFWALRCAHAHKTHPKKQLKFSYCDFGLCRREWT
ncbi:MAG: hypothetical protein RML94_12390 [Bacteroidia bacterium]|nr:hypothetical protein [Bacteroidia bacterium]